mmetsp:Transcript_10256/g.17862  ORF Transcript_10256/g.17862 Transcript_10256/m.17862 type:complete len:87 (-) Transcript_10256:39-299(-)
MLAVEPSAPRFDVFVFIPVENDLGLNPRLYLPLHLHVLWALVERLPSPLGSPLGFGHGRRRPGQNHALRGAPALLPCPPAALLPGG